MDQQTPIQNSLLDDLGLSDISKEKQEELLIKMTEVLLKSIFIETMEKLDDKGRDEYESLVENGGSAKQMEEFLKSKIPNYEAMVQKVVDDFKSEMKAKA